MDIPCFYPIENSLIFHRPFRVNRTYLTEAISFISRDQVDELERHWNFIVPYALLLNVVSRGIQSYERSLESLQAHRGNIVFKGKYRVAECAEILN